jgi:molybdopterin-containing oxidoreductase family iron-sulfur binding subunit
LVLNLYDPDRLNGPRRNLLNEKRTNRDTVSADYGAADEAIHTNLKKGGVALLTGTVVSPATRSLIEDFTRAFRAQHYVWDSINYDLERQSQADCYGTDVLPRWRPDQAEVIVSIGADFLGTFMASTEQMRLFSQGRDPLKKMSKLVVFESLLSLTGANADQRHAVAPEQLLDVAYGLLHEIVVKMKRSRWAGQDRVERILKPFADVSGRLGIEESRWTALAEELWQARGRSLVMGGGESARTPEGLKLLNAINMLNSVLENDGRTVDFENSHQSWTGRDQSLTALMQALRDGKVKTLIVHGCNPAYVTRAFAEAVAQAEMVVCTADRNDETAQLSHYVLPDHHAFENWADAEPFAGLYLLGQPTIEPMYNTRAFQDTLIAWLRAQGGFKAESWYDYLRTYWQGQIYPRARSGTFDEFWYAAQQKGLIDTRPSREPSGRVRTFRSEALAESQPHAAGTMSLSLYTNMGLRDGSLANVGWLQEFPDPVSKVCWDNYVSVSPGTAAKLALHEWQIVKVKTQQGEVKASVHIQPGQHDDVCGLAVGYGRVGAGKVATGVGVNAYPLSPWPATGRQFAGVTMSLEATKDFSRLANTVGHHSMEGRQIVVEATLAQYQKNPGANIHRHKMLTLWPKHEYKSHKWGMAIDLSTCTGCSACVIACQSENNIPVVGKRHVIKGREMHWMRIDRYYVGDPASPDTVVMPMLCQHCDNAPCETVCPVAATVHGDEGTNDMIYNRCVGTRYCANNCPYKVRRFNWFSYTNVEKPLNYAMNPDVTVRHRGVMEKCSFCTHRIKDAKLKALKDNGRKRLKDGEVVTACEQSCPTGAIVFGDLNDPESRVSKLQARQNSYTLLEELNNQPAVRYLSKVRNTDQLKGATPHHGTSNDEKGHHS